MKASELKKVLEEVITKNGDIEVEIAGDSRIETIDKKCMGVMDGKLYFDASYYGLGGFFAENTLETNGGNMFDVNQIDEAFQFARDNANLVVDQLLVELDKRFLSPKIKNKIMLSALKENFTVYQVWERLNDKERKAIFPLLNPEEIVELRSEGASFDSIND